MSMLPITIGVLVENYHPYTFPLRWFFFLLSLDIKQFPLLTVRIYITCMFRLHNELAQKKEIECAYTVCVCVVAASARKFYADVWKKAASDVSPRWSCSALCIATVIELTAHLHIFHAWHAYVCIHNTIEYNCAGYTIRKAVRQIISHTSACVCYVNRIRKLTFDKQDTHTTVLTMSHKQSMQSVCSNRVIRVKNTIFLLLWIRKSNLVQSIYNHV